ncbi:hypothetical protein [Lacticaseibacillus saniviri]|uniref:hypothetical protein n=1 Tax=Lacticaseibacillus saniviri TaxID=931533 RepID=UPI000AC33634|nr:hypothetical protein [Lacticaseibacillus saniviri]
MISFPAHLPEPELPLIAPHPAIPKTIGNYSIRASGHNASGYRQTNRQVTG